MTEPTDSVFSDADVAELYDVLNPWNSGGFRADAAFYDPRILAAASVLDVGCGTGSALKAARAAGHTGRLVGIDPDVAALERARRCDEVAWVEGRAADVGRWPGAFELAVMTGNAFQCLIEDDDVRASLAAVRTALCPGGRFAFETRHPQARAWQDWPIGVTRAQLPDGRVLHVTYQIDAIVGDVVHVAEITASPGVDAAPDRVLRVDRMPLRFLDVPKLNGFLAGAGFAIGQQHGGWVGEPLSPQSTMIVTVARRL
ncbi:class I SAM-dependent DNA methyltransferase [Actinospica robiniae]|uniref:class I SAM-dependent DNA methyltransferase n=1 Tax=Actinospica robiniae TaxID=304901 RepID=UPI001B7F8294|nr:class I SAM-dependent methyltransferase [Actinospica robiniae]